MPDSSEFDAVRADFLNLKQLALPLQRRRRLHPLDPEALDEEEEAALRDLEEQMEDL